MNFIRLNQVDFARTNEHVAALADLCIVGFRAIVEAIITHDSLPAVEHAVQRVDMRVIMNARALAVPGLAFGEAVDRKAVIGIFVEK